MAEAFNPQNYVNPADKTPVERITDGMTGSTRNNIDSNAPANGIVVSRALLEAGTSASTGADVVAQSVDALAAAGTGPYTTNTNPARAAAEDINRSRIAGIYNARDYMPTARIADKRDRGNDIIYALVDADGATIPAMQIGFAKYERPNPFQPAKWTSSFKIVLPLPTELSDMSASRWNPTELGTVGDLANLFGAGDTASTGSSAAVAGALALNASQTIINAAGRTLANRPALGPIAALGSIVSDQSQNLATLLQQNAGVAPNPNPSMTFNGPQLRQYTYSWMFHPNNREESENIKTIINELKRRSLPSTYIGTNTALLQYPEMCLIHLFPWDIGAQPGPDGYGHKFIKYKKSVITSVNVSYSPSGVPAFFGERKTSNSSGPSQPKPAFIGLSISFSEIEFFTANDYGTGPGTGSLGDLVTGAFGLAEGVKVQADNVVRDNATVITTAIPDLAGGDNTDAEGEPEGGEGQ